jgi:hypothetical protein
MPYTCILIVMSELFLPDRIGVLRRDTFGGNKRGMCCRMLQVKQLDCMYVLKH